MKRNNAKQQNKKFYLIFIIISILLIFLYFKYKPFYNISFENWNTAYTNYLSSTYKGNDINTFYYYYKYENGKILKSNEDESDLVLSLSKQHLRENKYNIFFSYVWLKKPINFDKYQISINNLQNTTLEKVNINRAIINNSNFNIKELKENSTYSIAPGSNKIIFSNLSNKAYTKGPYTSDIISFVLDLNEDKNVTISYNFNLEDRKAEYKIEIPD